MPPLIIFLICFYYSVCIILLMSLKNLNIFIFNMRREIIYTIRTKPHNSVFKTNAKSCKRLVAYIIFMKSSSY